ncbi:MAG: OmpA family protein [Burkholderiaceae bacterium]|nr:OmpA family protein [Burkholderiaceae bacterium]
MDDDQQNEPGLLLAWILGIAVTIAIVVAVLSGVLSALGSSSASSAAPAAPVTAAAPAADKPAEGAAAPAAAMGPAKLYFSTGKAELPAEAAATLAPLIDALKAGKAKKLVISGYHDATGDPVQNAELAKQRAFAVRDALTGAGLTAEQIELSKPQETTGGSGDDREARRVEVSAQQ